MGKTAKRAAARRPAAPADPPPSQPLKVVAIGGGTGLSSLLSGLKHHVGHAASGAPTPLSPQIESLTAVVTISDDGGSSGRLRREFNILPPGDIRNCLVALSADETLLSRLFQYRFSGGSGLEGHSFGNLFLTALTGVTGDFADAVKLASEVLATRGHIVPASNSNVQLVAVMDDGSRVFGETSITACSRRIVELRLVPPDVEPLPQTLEAIAAADLITVGPGSLFTSLICNLLVRGVAQAIAASPALKVFICNLMTQANESLGMSAADHLRALRDHAKLQLFDVALVNRAPLSRKLRAKYALEGASQIVYDRAALEEMGLRVVEGDYLEEAGVARHAASRVAQDVLRLAAAARAARRGTADATNTAPQARAKMAGHADLATD